MSLQVTSAQLSKAPDRPTSEECNSGAAGKVTKVALGAASKPSPLQTIATRWSDVFSPDVAKQAAKVHQLMRKNKKEEAEQLLAVTAERYDFIQLHQCMQTSRWEDAHTHLTSILNTMSLTSEYYELFCQLYRYYLKAQGVRIRCQQRSLEEVVTELAILAQRCEDRELSSLAKETYQRLKQLDTRPGTIPASKGADWWGYREALLTQREGLVLHLNSCSRVTFPPKKMIDTLFEECPYAIEGITHNIQGGVCFLNHTPHHKGVYYWVFIFKRPVPETLLKPGHQPAYYSEALQMDRYRQGAKFEVSAQDERMMKRDLPRRKGGMVYPVIRFFA